MSSIPKRLRPILFIAPFLLAMALVILFYNLGALSNILFISLSSIVVIVALVAAFLRYSSAPVLGGVMLFCIPFFIVEFALIYADLGIIPSDGVKPDFMDYLYFSVVTFTTLGYGDFRPSEAARMYAALEALLGYVLLGIFVSVLVLANPRVSGDAPAKPSRTTGKRPKLRTRTAPKQDALNVNILEKK